MYNTCIIQIIHTQLCSIALTIGKTPASVKKFIIILTSYILNKLFNPWRFELSEVPWVCLSHAYTHIHMVCVTYIRISGVAHINIPCVTYVHISHVAYMNMSRVAHINIPYT